MIIDFKQSEEYYIAKAVEYSAGGDSYKSLLCARHAGESLEAHKHLARALYESGNFAQAHVEYMRLLFERNADDEETYAYIAKNLCAMSRYYSASKVLTDAFTRGYFDKILKEEPDTASSVKKAYKKLRLEYKDYVFDYDVARALYILSIPDFSSNHAYLLDMWLDGKSFADTTMLYRAASVAMPGTMSPTTAQSFLELYIDKMSPEDRERQDVLATRVTALMTLGREDEAEECEQFMSSLELPDDPIDSYKCAIASSIMSNSESACDYFENILTACFNKNILSFVGMTSLNIGDDERSAEVFGNVLLIEPTDYVAKYWLKKIHAREKCYNSDFISSLLPKSEERRIRNVITDYLLSQEYALGKPCSEPDFASMLNYVVGKNDGFSREVLIALARGNVYGEVVTRFLYSAEHDLTTVRDVIAEIFINSEVDGVNVFAYGPRHYERPERTGNNSLYRAYVLAYVTSQVFAYHAEESVTEVMERVACLPLSLVDEEDVYSFAVALFATATNVTEIKSVMMMFERAREDFVATYLKMLGGRFKKPNVKNAEDSTPKKKTGAPKKAKPEED